jgi:transmembrane sensor
VIAGDAEVRVTGTKFDVRRSGGAVRVSVLEGRVEVRRHRLLPILASDAPALVLTAGLKTSLPAGAESFSSPEAALIPAGDWRGGRFFYRDASLAEIVSDLKRYSADPIHIPDPAIGQLKVTTSFQAGETEQFLDNLSTILPVVKRRDRDGTITLEARPSVE